MSDYFPPEIFYEILIRLPVKSLCRFTVVSKSWYALITSQKFISSHLNHTLATNQKSLLLRRYTKEDAQEHYTLHHENDVLNADPVGFKRQFGLPHREFGLPIKAPFGYFRIVSYCDGLVCLTDDLFSDKSMILLANPSIQRYVKLPTPEIKPDWPHMFVLGFGCDLLRKDYKVVRIVYRANDQFDGFEVPPEVEIYSHKNRKWRRIMNAQILCNVIEFKWTHAFVNGCSHWIASKDYGRRVLLLSFDMSDEVFTEISLPKVVAREPSDNLFVNVYRGSLAVIEYRYVPVESFCQVWVMKEYGDSGSWTILYRIQLGMATHMDRVVGFFGNEVLMLKTGSQLFLYYPKTRVVLDLGMSGSARAFYVDNYVESLVLLEEGVLFAGMT